MPPLVHGDVIDIAAAHLMILERTSWSVFTLCSGALDSYAAARPLPAQEIRWDARTSTPEAA